jgi:hypothetical protein
MSRRSTTSMVSNMIHIPREAEVGAEAEEEVGAEAEAGADTMSPKHITSRATRSLTTLEETLGPGTRKRGMTLTERRGTLGATEAEAVAEAEAEAEEEEEAGKRATDTLKRRPSRSQSLRRRRRSLCLRMIIGLQA